MALLARRKSLHLSRPNASEEFGKLKADWVVACDAMGLSIPKKAEKEIKQRIAKANTKNSKSKLNLSHCNLTDHHVINLLDQIKNHVIISKLELAGNPITSEIIPVLRDTLVSQVADFLCTPIDFRLDRAYLGDIIFEEKFEQRLAFNHTELFADVNNMLTILKYTNAQTQIRNKYKEAGAPEFLDKNTVTKIWESVIDKDDHKLLAEFLNRQAYSTKRTSYSDLEQALLKAWDAYGVINLVIDNDRKRVDAILRVCGYSERFFEEDEDYQHVAKQSSPSNAPALPHNRNPSPPLRPSNPLASPRRSGNNKEAKRSMDQTGSSDVSSQRTKTLIEDAMGDANSGNQYDSNVSQSAKSLSKLFDAIADDAPSASQVADDIVNPSVDNSSAHDFQITNDNILLYAETAMSADRSDDVLIERQAVTDVDSVENVEVNPITETNIETADWYEQPLYDVPSTSQKEQRSGIMNDEDIMDSVVASHNLDDEQRGYTDYTDDNHTLPPQLDQIPRSPHYEPFVDAYCVQDENENDLNIKLLQTSGGGDDYISPLNEHTVPVLVHEFAEETQNSLAVQTTPTPLLVSGTSNLNNQIIHDEPSANISMSPQLYHDSPDKAKDVLQTTPTQTTKNVKISGMSQTPHTKDLSLLPSTGASPLKTSPKPRKSPSLPPSSPKIQVTADVTAGPGLVSLNLKSLGLTSSKSVYDTIQHSLIEIASAIFLQDNQIDDLSVFAFLASFPHLANLNISNNLLSGRLPQSLMPRLLIRLDVSHNKITDLSALLLCTKLEMLDASHNAVKNLIGLPPTLTYLDLSHNEIVNQFTLRVLATCKKLSTLFISGNPAFSGSDYKSSVSLTFPCLEVLDGYELSRKLVAARKLKIKEAATSLKSTKQLSKTSAVDRKDASQQSNHEASASTLPISSQRSKGTSPKRHHAAKSSAARASKESTSAIDTRRRLQEERDFNRSQAHLKIKSKVDQNRAQEESKRATKIIGAKALPPADIEKLTKRLFAATSVNKSQSMNRLGSVAAPVTSSVSVDSSEVFARLRTSPESLRMQQKGTSGKAQLLYSSPGRQRQRAVSSLDSALRDVFEWLVTTDSDISNAVRIFNIAGYLLQGSTWDSILHQKFLDGYKLIPFIPGFKMPARIDEAASIIRQLSADVDTISKQISDRIQEMVSFGTLLQDVNHLLNKFSLSDNKHNLNPLRSAMNIIMDTLVGQYVNDNILNMHGAKFQASFIGAVDSSALEDFDHSPKRISKSDNLDNINRSPLPANKRMIPKSQLAKPSASYSPAREFQANDRSSNMNQFPSNYEETDGLHDKVTFNYPWDNDDPPGLLNEWEVVQRMEDMRKRIASRALADNLDTKHSIRSPLGKKRAYYASLAVKLDQQRHQDSQQSVEDPSFRYNPTDDFLQGQLGSELDSAKSNPSDFLLDLLPSNAIKLAHSTQPSLSNLANDENQQPLSNVDIILSMHPQLPVIPPLAGKNRSDAADRNSSLAPLASLTSEPNRSESNHRLIEQMQYDFADHLDDMRIDDNYGYRFEDDNTLDYGDDPDNAYTIDEGKYQYYPASDHESEEEIDVDMSFNFNGNTGTKGDDSEIFDVPFAQLSPVTSKNFEFKNPDSDDNLVELQLESELEDEPEFEVVPEQYGEDVQSLTEIAKEEQKSFDDHEEVDGSATGGGSSNESTVEYLSDTSLKEDPLEKISTYVHMKIHTVDEINSPPSSPMSPNYKLQLTRGPFSDDMELYPRRDALNSSFSLPSSPSAHSAPAKHLGDVQLPQPLNVILQEEPSIPSTAEVTSAEDVPLISTSSPYTAPVENLVFESSLGTQQITESEEQVQIVAASTDQGGPKKASQALRDRIKQRLSNIRATKSAESLNSDP